VSSSKRSISGRRRAYGAAAAALVGVGILALGSSRVGRGLEYQLAHRLEYTARVALDRGPGIHPRLKIFGFDDVAMQSYQAPELGVDDWVRILKSVSAAKPRAILIDKMFSMAPTGQARKLPALAQALRQSGRVGAGIFFHDYLLTQRPPLELDRKEFRLSELASGRIDSPASLEWLPQRAPNAYGPAPVLANAFERLGHLVYRGEGRIVAMWRANANVAVPHLALTAAKQLKVTSEGLLVDKRFVPLDAEGRLPVDLVEPSTLYRNTRSMTQLLESGRAGLPAAHVKEGDVVILLPLLYTGNHDVAETPLGFMPGGFVLASAVNSVLRGAWLVPLDQLAVPAVLVATAFAFLLGMSLGPYAFWGAFLPLVALLPLAGVTSFIVTGTMVPWLWPLAAFVGSGLVGNATVVQAWVRDNRRLRHALKGSVPEAKLKRLLKGKGRLELEASERVVTLMFIDIANFSLVAEQSTPKEVFNRLKSIIKEVTKTIHQYGGTVDRTLGDGILCFFGYSYDGEQTRNQADQAIRCAIEIQRRHVKRCLESAKTGEPVMPLRIGINTGSVYIGDIGDGERIDFTVIGNGVNYAQRLEAACDHHAIMVSATSMDFAASFTASMPGFTKRLIHIKHHDELIEAIEYDPFHDAPEMRAQVQQMARKDLNLERREQRFAVDEGARLNIATDFGSAGLVDFSTSGACLRLPSYLARGITLELRVSSIDDRVAARLASLGLATLKAEVRWAKASGRGYTHGLKFLNLSSDQLTELFAVLREACSAPKAATAPQVPQPPQLPPSKPLALARVG
jgi:class 3 adenylate cyclase